MSVDSIDPSLLELNKFLGQIEYKESINDSLVLLPCLPWSGGLLDGEDVGSGRLIVYCFAQVGPVLVSLVMLQYGFVCIDAIFL